MTFHNISSEKSKSATNITKKETSSSPTTEHIDERIERKISITRNVIPIDLKSIPQMRSNSDITHNSNPKLAKNGIKLDLSPAQMKAFSEFHFSSPLTHGIPTTPLSLEPEKVTVWVILQI